MYTGIHVPFSQIHTYKKIIWYWFTVFYVQLCIHRLTDNYLCEEYTKTRTEWYYEIQLVCTQGCVRRQGNSISTQFTHKLSFTSVRFLISKGCVTSLGIFIPPTYLLVCVFILVNGHCFYTHTHTLIYIIYLYIYIYKYTKVSK